MMEMKQNQQSELSKKIIENINHHPLKRITFYDFMNMALYAPKLGYYTKNKIKIGKQADFYTSTSVSSVFGHTIARHFAELFPYISDEGKNMILEMGGGDGRLARDVLDELKENYPGIYFNSTYYMLEVSPFHQEIQYELLKDHLDRMIWIQQLEELPVPFNGIIFSNELVDSFPVHKVKKRNGKIEEIYVTWNEQDHSFAEVVDEVSDNRLITYFMEQNIDLREGQTAEVNLDAIEWINSIGRLMNRGYVLTIDYGYPVEELYASHRHEGTLMCYYQHVANDHPYENIGNQDITTHVNFSVLMDVGEKIGLHTVWFTTQSYFLLNNGILNELKEIQLESLERRDLFKDEALKVNRAIRQLITPGEMGETFKVLIQQKNIGHQEYLFLTDIWKQYGI